MPCYVSNAGLMLEEERKLSVKQIAKQEHPKCIDCLSSLTSRPFQVLVHGPERDFIASKISPRKIPSVSRICNACWIRVKRNVQMDNDRNVIGESSVPREPRQQLQPTVADVIPTFSSNDDEDTLQHAPQILCMCCKIPLSGIQSHPLPEGPIRDEIAAMIFPSQITASSRVCHTCWDSALRNTQRQEQEQHQQQLEVDDVDEPQQESEVADVDEPQHQPEIADVVEPHQQLEVADVDEPQQEPEVADMVEQQQQPEVADVIPTYSSSDDEDTLHSNEYLPEILCVRCAIPLSGIRSHPLPEDPIRDEIAARIFPSQITASSRACHTCWVSSQRNTQRREQEESATWSLTQFKRSAETSTHCFVPGCTNCERLVIPDYLRQRILKEYKIYITTNARICQVHKTMYNWDGIEELPFSSIFTKAQVEEMLLLNIHSPRSTFLDFENYQNIPDSLFHYWTGRTVEQFLHLHSMLPLFNEVNKKPLLSLGLYSSKLRTGDSNARLANLFQLSEATVSRLVQKTRNALLQEFVPRNLGFSRINRENVLQRNLTIPRGLFGDPSNETVIAIFDGTYIYLQKSSNYSFQKKSYSLHKYRNLLKPFLVVSTDGHILDVYGPYAATTSDADIMRALFENENQPMRQFFRPNDALLLDRGFRDVVPFLRSLKYNVYKPASLLEGETQLTTIDANQSRCVTLCRWVVEVVKGRFKRDFKLLRQEYFNTASTHLMDDVRICAALLNAYHPVIVDRPDAQLILDRALRFLNVPNYLSQYVLENNINRRRAQFERIDGDHPEIMFPEMEMTELTLFGLGIYQLKQARSYFGEHIRQNGRFIIEIASNVEVENVPGLSSSQNTKLIRARIKSRHHSGKIYYTYVLINEDVIQIWEESICGYYCNCICGKRTVGCCAHVMTIVWYLGWARHQETIIPPAPFLDDIIVREDIENE